MTPERSGSDPAACFESMDQEAAQTSGRSEGALIQPCPQKETRKLRLALRDFGFELYTNLDYELEVDGTVLQGNSGESGVIEQPVSPAAESARLLVWTDDDPESLPEEWDLTFDDIDPIAVDTGAEMRLHNLSVFWSAKDPATQRALQEFQATLNVEPGKEVDDPTRAALAQVYSAQGNPSPVAKGWEAPEVVLDEPDQMAAPPEPSSFLGQLEESS